MSSPYKITIMRDKGRIFLSAHDVIEILTAPEINEDQRPIEIGMELQQSIFQCELNNGGQIPGRLVVIVPPNGWLQKLRICWFIIRNFRILYDTGDTEIDSIGDPHD